MNRQLVAIGYEKSQSAKSKESFPNHYKNMSTSEKNSITCGNEHRLHALHDSSKDCQEQKIMPLSLACSNLVVRKRTRIFDDKERTSIKRCTVAVHKKRGGSEPNMIEFPVYAEDDTFNEAIEKFFDIIGYEPGEPLRENDKDAWFATTMELNVFCVFKFGSRTAKDLFLRFSYYFFFFVREERINDEVRALMLKTEKLMEPVLDKIARQFGYCCSQDYHFLSQKLVCVGGSGCRIEGEEEYHKIQYKWGDLYCKEHYMVADYPVNRCERKVDLEERRQCKKCLRYNHPICCLFDPKRPDDSFDCHLCHDGPKKVHSLQDLVETKCSKFIEHGLKTFVNDSKISVDVSCRVLSAIERKRSLFHSYPNMFKNLENVLIEDKIPYTYKMIGVTEKIDKQDVFIFKFSVHEYRKIDPSHPKYGQIYIEHVDSAKFFSQPEYRTQFYQEVLLSYFKYAAENGFKKVHIYSKPPLEKKSYLINCYPVWQLIPSQDILNEWYVSLLKIGKERGIISSWTRGYTPTKKDNIKRICEKLSFEDEFLLEKLDACIGQKTKRSEKEFKNSFKKEIGPFSHCLFYINLRSQQKEVVEEEGELIDSSFAGSYDTYLQKQREENWQFRTLPFARYSSMKIISTLKKERYPEDIITID